MPWNLFTNIDREISILRKQFISIKVLPQNIRLSSPSTLIATWFGAGLIQPMTGTWGSLLAIPIGYLVISLWGWKFLFLAIAIASIVGYWATDVYSKKIEEHDAKSVVIDEVVGTWISVLNCGTDISCWILAFILFRIFDTAKLWPASYFDNKIEGSFNVIMDDVIAGFYALVSTSLIFLLVT